MFHGVRVARVAVPFFHLTQASMLLPIVTALQGRGVPIDSYLERARIPRKLLYSPYAPIPKRTHFWHFLDEVAEREGFETIGFLLGDPLDLAQTGPWGRNVLRSISLFEALNKASRTIRHLAQGNTIRIERRGGRAELHVVNEDRLLSRVADHTTLKLFLTLVGMVADRDWKPARASLRTGRLESVEAMPIFENCDLRFGQSSAMLEIPEEYLSRPLPIYQHEPRGVEVRLFQLPDDGRLSSKLQTVLATFLPHYGPLPVEEAAEILGVSRTTMFRQLALEGESYRNLIERVRFTAARQYLSTRILSVKEISHALGYQNPNNFTRAFHRLAGISPSDFRRQDAGPQGLPASA